MRWRARGLVLAARRHGENAMIVSLLSAEKGRHAGLVPGGASRRNRAMLEPGTLVDAVWQARLADQLGRWTLEPVRPYGAALLGDGDRLAALSAACALLETCLAERNPQTALFPATLALFDHLEGAAWAEAYVHWEIGLLAALGYGLDLDRCAATGATEDLIYVSPRSGRAVSRAAGAPWRDRLLALPGLLSGRPGPDHEGEVLDGLKLTGFFLNDRLMTPQGAHMPAARTRLMDRLTRRRKGGGTSRDRSPT